MASLVERSVNSLGLGLEKMGYYAQQNSTQVNGDGPKRDREVDSLKEELARLRKELQEASAERDYLRSVSTLDDTKDELQRRRSADLDETPSPRLDEATGEASVKHREDPRVGQPKRILIIGGGPAGLISLHEVLNPLNRASGTSLDGYKIQLYERRAEVGGVWYFEPENDVAKGWHHGNSGRVVPQEGGDRLTSESAGDGELLGGTDWWKKYNASTNGASNVSDEYDDISDATGALKSLSHADVEDIAQHSSVSEQDFCYISSPQNAPRWPSPAYEGLVGNVLPPLLEFSAERFRKPSDGLFPSMVETHAYLLRLARRLRDFIKTNQEVIDIQPASFKRGTAQPTSWTVKTRNWDEEEGGKETTEEWDAIIVAAGAFDNPYYPELPGLAPLIKERSPLIMHAKAYPGPRPFVNQHNKIVVVGNANSANDIAAHLAPLNHGAPLYRCIRHESNFAHLPDPRIKDVPPIKSMGRSKDGSTLSLVLEDGMRIDGVTKVIFASGYQYWFPWIKVPKLPSKADGVEPELEMASRYGAVPNLHEATLVASAPTLAFIGLGQGSTPMPLAEIQARLVSRIFHNTLVLPLAEKPEDLLTTFYERAKELGLRDDDPARWRMLHMIRGKEERRLTARLIDYLENNESGSSAGLFRWDQGREEIAKNMRAVKESELRRLRKARVAAGGVDGGVGGVLSEGPGFNLVNANSYPTTTPDFNRGRAVGL